MPRNRRSTAWALLVAFAAVSCSSASTPPDSPPAAGSAEALPATSAGPRTDASGEANTSGPRPDENGPPEPVRIDVIENICKAAPCSTKKARVHVSYLDSRVHRYAHEADPAKCAHAPMVVYDRDGKEVGRLPNKPVQKGSPQEAEHNTKRVALFEASKQVASLDCTGQVVPSP